MFYNFYLRLWCSASPRVPAQIRRQVSRGSPPSLSKCREEGLCKKISKYFCQQLNIFVKGLCPRGPTCGGAGDQGRVQGRTNHPVS